MKTIKLVVLVISMLMMTSLSAQNKKMLDEKNGFRELKFGMSIDSVSNLKLIDGNGISKYYEKTDDKLTIGDYAIESITYGFYKGKLSFIMITTVGYANSKGVLNLFTTQYGKGYQSNQYIEEYWWFGKTVSLNYKENSINNNGKIIMSTNIFDDEKAADKKAATEKAKNDL